MSVRNELTVHDSKETPPPKDRQIIGFWINGRHTNAWGTTWDADFEDYAERDEARIGGWELQTVVTQNDPDFWMEMPVLTER